MERQLQPYTPLMMAIMQGMPAGAVQFALNSMMDGNEWVDRNDPNMNITPLMAVMCCRDDENPDSIAIARLLVKKGAGVNTRDSGPGATPLWMTAQLGKVNLMKFLIQNGARVDMNTTSSQTTTITIACMNGHAECVALLANEYSKQNLLHLMNVPNQLQNRTGAWCAVARGFPEIIGILAKAGADFRSACPCWYEEFIMDGDRTANMDVCVESSPITHALDAAVFSHVHSSCIVCRTKQPDIQKCSRCLIASYCSAQCQKKDFKSSHKKVCKRIRKGMDMYHGNNNNNNNNTTTLPPQSSKKFGFTEAFAGEDLELPYEEYNLDDVPVWEYDNGPPGREEWRRYPPSIERSIESLLESGSPKYMYRPGHPDNSGVSEREISPRMPSGVSSNYIWYSTMTEREVYTGAGRAVRRNGSTKAPKRRPMMDAPWMM